MTTFNVMVPVASVLALPFVPMLHELIRRSDVAALPIGDGPFVDQALLAAHWHDALRAHVAGTPPADASAVPPWQTLGLAVQHADAIHVARDAHRDDVLYADRTITLDEGAQAAYAFADEHIDIHAGATIGTLAHAPLIDVDDAVLRGVVVGDTVRLRGAGGFACLYGEPLVFGAAPGPRPADTPAAPRRAISLTRHFASLPHRFLHGRYLLPCDVRLPAHTVVQGNLIVEGALVLGEGCVLRGSVKAHRVELERHALLHGAVFARDDVLLAHASCIDGVVSAGGLLRLTGARIGVAGHPVSACARDVSVVNHACVHGDLVAWRSGWFHTSR
ncbi:polymer-forming cytoskeletal protein [Burkholderia cenocepacia]|uniref:polymer-forming cytoskeletal protein n=1 Tax=Burkholderia cenocepacia TaxID=95486 RepID=UPI000980DEDA|nr:polymer-forming cytoskeletal protein [Burkholderia cenocepacia]AQQ26909.1 N-acetylglucosamine-1-phosphate uridyltransferase [Burkholderia cenocepacia]ONV83040.1 N-acetylglucosamine-1-phosphate uridyltransferase [Burkholderia cenocepacia]ONV87590.1 N-acetylglucosamine-1-phosphate uridyltransferase [Burkholderia cenocepacia]ONW13733.1 N-acetylglucosamine-1-phosphate uridyltransferase [Burkholderia cenocepacia]ONW46361.1 N-acetylglucosamine-1-phosphate uridyltransferase [Burkholderia cenocepac